MSGERSVDAVTFDFWQTLVALEVDVGRTQRVSAWADVLACAGKPVEAPVLHAVFDRVAERFDSSWKANRQYEMVDAVGEASELLGLDADLTPALTSAWLAAARRTPVSAAAGVADTLAALTDAGVRVAVVCDVGLTPSVVLTEYLERLGLLGFFDHLTWSDRVGTYKPSAAMFDDALGALGTEPRRAAHIGDRRATDVAGARSRGMLAVRYRGLYDDTDDSVADANVVLDDHADLVDVVLGSRVG